MIQIDEDCDESESSGNAKSNVGVTFGKVLLAVIYTFRATVVRIISARTPRKAEIKDYLENGLTQQSKRNEEN